MQNKMHVDKAHFQEVIGVSIRLHREAQIIKVM